LTGNGYSALARGRLTRKPAKEQNETLRAQTDALSKMSCSPQENAVIVQGGSDVAEARGLSMAQVSLAWMLPKPVMIAHSVYDLLGKLSHG